MVEYMESISRLWSGTFVPGKVRSWASIQPLRRWSLRKDWQRTLLWSDWGFYPNHPSWWLVQTSYGWPGVRKYAFQSAWDRFPVWACYRSPLKRCCDLLTMLSNLRQLCSLYLVEAIRDQPIVPEWIVWGMIWIIKRQSDIQIARCGIAWDIRVLGPVQGQCGLSLRMPVENPG